MALRILTEASGSLTSGYIIKAIQKAGHICVASDVNNTCFGRYLADDFTVMPKKDDPALWKIVEKLLIEKRIDVIIPSLDETLLGWAERKDYFRALGIYVIISDRSTVLICQDKWLTYKLFVENRIPTPKTSLTQEYPLVKPRFGRGAVGVKVTSEHIEMHNMISQELLKGVEYTVDVFCDRNSNPIYIVPRRRINVRNGKSTEGIVEEHSNINSWISTISQRLSFVGPINMQCFVMEDGSISFVEINPRIAGGMALGFAATENWMNLIIENIINERDIIPKPVQYGLEMKRYYAEIFVSPS